MSRRNDKIIAIYQQHQIMSKAKNEVFIQKPMGACFSLTFDFIDTFLKMVNSDEKFKANFFTDELNYLEQDNSLGRPDRTSIGKVEGYEILKSKEYGEVFLRNPMGAFCGFSVEFIEYLQKLINDENYKQFFERGAK